MPMGVAKRDPSTYPSRIKPQSWCCIGNKNLLDDFAKGRTIDQRRIIWVVLKKDFHPLVQFRTCVRIRIEVLFMKVASKPHSRIGTSNERIDVD